MSTSKKVSKSHKLRNRLLAGGILLLAAGLVTWIYLSDRVQFYDDPSTTGNTSANLLNGGLFAEAGDTIYFANPYDQNTLYSMDQNLEKVTRLNGDNVSYLNVAAPYIFYTRRNDKKQIDSDMLLNLKTTGLYRTNQKGAQMDVLYDGPTQALCLYGNSVYYQHYDSEKGLLLYSIGIDGSEDKLLLEQPAAAYAINNDTIYYTGMDTDHKIYSMNLDGSGSQVIYDGNCTSLTLEDGWLYFLDMSQDYILCRMRTDGSQLEALTSQRLATYNVSGGTVYYQVDNGTDNGLYSFNIEEGSSSSRQLRSGNFNYIHVLSKYLFFEEYDGSVLYVMDRKTGQIREFQP